MVTGAVDRSVANPREINDVLTSEYLNELTLAYPGVTWSLGGAEETNRQTLGSLQRNTAISFLAIFAILATVFRSYTQPVIIMFIIPFGIVGAFLGHMVMGLPVTFLSIFGITTLGGVLVNDGIVPSEIEYENRLLT